MHVVRGRQAGRPSHRPTQGFIGGALQDYVLDIPEVRIQNVYFEPGARTQVHAHPDGQVLLMTAGDGQVATQGGQVESVRAGDIIYTPPGEFHWHGATETAWATFLAISIGRPPDWLPEQK